MKPIVKTRKSKKCSLCGNEIESGETRFLIKDGETNEMLNCHVCCINSVHKLCDECSEKECKGFSQCFKKSIKEIKTEEIMERLKFFFDNVDTIKSVEIMGNMAKFRCYDGSYFAEINLSKMFGPNCIISNTKQIHREWYNENE